MSDATDIMAPLAPVANARLRILYVAMRYDYGDRSRGDSYEHTTFFDTLNRSGHGVHYFDFMTEAQECGAGRMNEKLCAMAARLKPDLAFFVLFKDEIQTSSIRRVAREGKTQTVNWFCDDHWRFSSFSRHYAPAFDWIVTTDREAPSKYAKLGLQKVLLSQWACNHYVFLPRERPKDLDALFVGQPHGDRRSVIRHLAKRGVSVATYGYGWPAGRVSLDEMLDLFARSKLVLNLANAPAPSAWNLPAILMRRWRPRRRQIKGRNFEVPGCRATLLTEYVPGIEDYFKLDDEIACFRTRAELVQRCHDLLANDRARQRLADAGYRRVLAEHTYVHRFNQLFSIMGLEGVGLAQAE